ncbi:MAG TPA: hypothetical protein DIC42_02840 [Holosporales bacterium]|nr:hypothetical protein [Holosporales bacterium]
MGYHKNSHCSSLFGVSKIIGGAKSGIFKGYWNPAPTSSMAGGHYVFVRKSWTYVHECVD